MVVSLATVIKLVLATNVSATDRTLFRVAYFRGRRGKKITIDKPAKANTEIVVTERSRMCL